MFDGRIIITNHAKLRYSERKYDLDKNHVVKQMLNELRPLNVKRIIRDEDNTLHVFTRFNNKFILIKNDKGEYIVKTVVRMNTEKRDRLINKLVCC